MSLNLIPLPVVKVLDPRVDLNNYRSYAILRGGSEVTWQAFPSTSFSPSQIQITANPPSQQVCVNRKPLLSMSFALQFTGIPPVGQTVLQPNFDAPRAYPIATVSNTLQVTLNNDQISANLNQYWSAISRYYNWKKQREFDYSVTPSMLDQYQQYVDWLDPYRGGGARNALGSYGITNDEGGRGGFQGLTIVNNPTQTVPGTTLTATAVLNVTEPLWLSPFLFDGEDKSGLVGVQNMSLTLTLGNLNRVWSHDPTSPVGSFTVSAGITRGALTKQDPDFAPTLLMNYITPDPIERLPSALSWDYFEIIPYPTTASSSLANNKSTVMTMNSVQLKTIPRRMYIFARRQDADLTFATTDTFAVINNLNVTFNNRVGIFSSASQQDLYEMSVKNGLNTPFSSFARYTGSVICVEFGTDLALASNEAPGLVGNYQLGVQVNMTNPALMENINPAPPANPVLYTLYVVVVNEGAISVLNGSVQHMVGVFSQMDILNSHTNPRVPYKKLKSIYGGDFFSSLGDIGRNLVSGVRRGFEYAKPLISKGLDLAQPFIPGPLGTAVKVGRMVTGVGMKMRKKKRKGGVLVGGKMISRSKLRSKL
jgi:hypothetical protein